MVTEEPSNATATVELASMEPRSFNRGDESGQVDMIEQEMLQWSHGRLTVVTASPLNRGGSGMCLLQWSHGRLTVVTKPYIRKLGYMDELQWSHGRLTVVTLKPGE